MASYDNDNSAVYWLILATSISSLTSAIFYIFQRSCSTCWGNISSICFQKFAECLEIREETFHEVTNLNSFPRMLQQLQLQSFMVIWKHDANAQTGDFLQFGWIRLPTKSYVLFFLSVLGVTHYVYIPSDLKSVSIVGPVYAISKLIDLSNVAATTRLTEVQLSTLREAFGMGNSWTTADRLCTLWERRVFTLLVSSILFCLGCKLIALP